MCPRGGEETDVRNDVESVIFSIIVRINSVYPELPIHSVKHLGSGQNNDVYLVNESLVFRFPRNQIAATRLRTEVTILAHLQGGVPLHVPNPVYVHLAPGAECMDSFMGYEKIPGNVITSGKGSLSPAQLDVVAGRLGDFLQSLHSLVISYDLATVLPMAQGLAYWEDMLEHIEYLLFPHMREDARRQVSNHFHMFFESTRDDQADVCLIHGDFGRGNILFNTDFTQVGGILDFGSACLGDPATDYAAASTIHPRILERMERHNPLLTKYNDRIEFYRGTFALQEALYGAEVGDEEAFRSGLTPYV